MAARSSASATRSRACCARLTSTTGERRWEFPFTTRVMGRRAVHRVRPGLRRRIGKRDGVRREERKKPLAFPDRLVPHAGAMTYMVDGRQYVLMPAGTTLTAFALAEF